MTLKEFPTTYRKKVKALNHVIYEIEQLINCTTLLKTHQADSILSNIILEAGLTHTRCLIEFFSAKKRGTRVVKGAKDSSPTGQTKEELDDILPKDFGFKHIGHLDHKKPKLNKYLSHLTYSRNKPTDWPLEHEAKPILEHALKFLTYLQDFAKTRRRPFKTYRDKIDSAIVNISALYPPPAKKSPCSPPVHSSITVVTHTTYNPHLRGLRKINLDFEA
jgi:hypothetical protein